MIDGKPEAYPPPKLVEHVSKTAIADRIFVALGYEKNDEVHRPPCADGLEGELLLKIALGLVAGSSLRAQRALEEVAAHVDRLRDFDEL